MARFLGSTKISPKQELLWALEDNIETPLEVGPEKTGTEILSRYIEEPDGMLDGGLHQSPYLERVKPSMSLFYEENNEHTHPFRHFYVPTSTIPPIFHAKGIAPYRAAFYARLAQGAFKTGHPYWGYRFLAWSIHYIQDVTQPWHTVLVPGISFLNVSRSKMEHEISGFHFLTEAFVDGWLLRQFESNPNFSEPRKPERWPAQLDPKKDRPWYVAELAESLAKLAHENAYDIAQDERLLFNPIEKKLDDHLKPKVPNIRIGNLWLPTAQLDFNGDGHGATLFLKPLWKNEFNLASGRDQLVEKLLQRIQTATWASRLVILEVVPPSGK
jgi:hypothetical protein